MVFVQKWPFFQRFFLGNKGQENVSYDIPKRKNSFLGFKKKKIKKSKKIYIFPKRLTHGFGPIMAIFLTFFFSRNIGLENVFYDILDRKHAFLGYKNKKIKKLKNWNFFKGVNSWFWSKDGHFSNFFFLGNIGMEKFFYDVLERKRGLSRL